MMLAIGIFLGPTACEQEPENLTVMERNRVDSMYREELKVLRIKMDSLCEIRMDSMVSFAVDSMLEEQLRAISRQLERIKKEAR